MTDIAVELNPTSPVVSKRRDTVLLEAVDLHYSIPIAGGCCKPKQSKKILHGVNMTLYPGQLTAIMGPSGSGKTTLLEALAGRQREGKITGNIMMNGKPLDKQRTLIKASTGYVKQKDLLLSTATVRETLEYSARLRLPTSLSDDEKMERVGNVITELGLTKCRDTPLGSNADGGGGNVKMGSGRGVSGGELKRVAIGVELITDPALLFLDEPTSGLDSAAAYAIVASLKRLAEKNCTVVCTIHQPRSNIWNLFDRIIFMADGNVLFNGKPSDAITFFGKMGHRVPEYVNPADYIMDVIADALPEDEKNPKAKSVPTMVKRFRKTWTKDSKAMESCQSTDDGWHRKILYERPGWWGQFCVLFVRAWRNNMRSSLILWAQLIQYVFLAVFVGLMYLRLGAKSVDPYYADNLTIVNDRVAALFFAVLNVSFVSAMTAVFVFPAERPIFNRERSAGHYGVLSYYLGITLSDLPMQIVFVIGNATITYWMVGLNPDFGRYVIFVALNLLTVLCMQSVALLLSALSGSADVANLLMSLVFLVFLSFAGYFVSIPNIPVFFIPLEYISPYKYVFRALLQNDFGGVVFACANAAIPCATPTGEAAIAAAGMTGLSVLADSMILLGMTVGFRIITYIVLLFVRIGGD